VVFISDLHSLNLFTSCLMTFDIVAIAHVDQVETFTVKLLPLLEDIVIV